MTLRFPLDDDAVRRICNGPELRDSPCICLVCGRDGLDAECALSLSDRPGVYEICKLCYELLTPSEKLAAHSEFKKAAVQNEAMQALADLAKAAIESHHLSALFRPRDEGN
jgi:hypothetical protein